jgi:hypothetical protein
MSLPNQIPPVTATPPRTRNGISAVLFYLAGELFRTALRWWHIDRVRAAPAGARYRASLAASQVIGLGLTRYVLGLEPLAAADLDRLVAAVGPTVDRYLTGDLG